MPNIAGRATQSGSAAAIRIWLKQIRPQFLVLSIVLVVLGASVARSEGYFDLLKFILTMAGLVLVHTSVNVLNDYADYKSGIDLDTIKTPFSGGSDVLPQKLLEPSIVYKAGLFCLVTAFLIGVYLVLRSGLALLPLIFFGGLTSFFYTSHLTKLPVAELFAGLGLGSLPVIGTYFVQTGHYSPEIIIASIAPGLLTANLLFLNEFPDYQADIKGGRGHLLIALGRKKAALLYAGLTCLVYLSIIVSATFHFMPKSTLIALLSIPAAIQAVRITMRKYDLAEAMIPALKANVITVLGTDLLLATGYFLSLI
jgi:1,4-dihydroxy-2-naphthoate polyprenyltransferase